MLRRGEGSGCEKSKPESPAVADAGAIAAVFTGQSFVVGCMEYSQFDDTEILTVADKKTTQPLLQLQ